MKKLKAKGLRRIGGKRGFTLIELLIVLTILAILAAVVVLALTGFIGRGESQACEAEQNSIQTAVYTWYYEKGDGTWPTAVDGTTIDWTAASDTDGNVTLVPDYLAEVPDSATKCDWQLTADGQVHVSDAAITADTCPCCDGDADPHIWCGTP